MALRTFKACAMAVCNCGWFTSGTHALLSRNITATRVCDPDGGNTVLLPLSPSCTPCPV